MLRSEKNEVYKKKKRNLSDVSWIDVIRKKEESRFYEVLLDFSSHFPQSSHMFSPQLLTASLRHCETCQAINHASANIITEANSGKQNVSWKPVSLECHLPNRFGVNKPVIKSGP